DVLGLLGPADYPGRFQPVQMRHPDVHQDDVGPFLSGQRDRLGAVAGLADDLEVRRGIDEYPEAAAHERLVVGHQDPDHLVTCAIGKQARTRKPPSGPGPALNSPPNTATRSRMPMIPCPESARGAGTSAGGAPAPESVTSTVTDSGRYLIVTSAAEAAPCLITAPDRHSGTRRTPHEEPPYVHHQPFPPHQALRPRPGGRGPVLRGRAGPGRVTGFLGPNGSGKTSTLRILLG